MRSWERCGNGGCLCECTSLLLPPSSKFNYQLGMRKRPDLVNMTTNQKSLFRSREWLSANQGAVLPDSVGS